MPSALSRSSLRGLKRPLVVATLTGSDYREQIKQFNRSRADVLELRLDTFPQKFHSFHFFRDFSRHVRSPILLTIRSRKESGKKILSAPGERMRSLLYRNLLHGADAVDIEIKSPIAAKVAGWARSEKVAVVLSHHNFKSTPSSAFLKTLERRALKLKGDVLKVAVMPKTEEDLRRFLKWGTEVKDIPVALVAMGPQGQVSRLIGFSFGSVLTYGHLGQSAAPGQISARELSKIIRGLYK